MSDIEEARRVLRVEAQSILDLVDGLDDDFIKAVDLIMACTGKLIITGIGKSGQIARKIASTFSSTGTPAVYLHPAESSHGDLGVIGEEDLVLGMSYGGENEEMVSILRFVARKNIPLIAITSRKDSSLGEAAKATLVANVREEACPLKLAPTSSSTASLAMGDALAMAVLKRRGFKREDFAERHPSGTLGRKLLTRVRDLMHSNGALPVVPLSEPMTSVLSAMTGKEVRGVAGVVDGNQDLVGIITDGDIRRRFEKSNEPLKEVAEDLMSRNPKTIDVDELAEKALFVMEQFQITRLFVVERNSDNPRRPVGIIDFSDLLKARIR